ncbi:MAG: multidrug effflux MFS transporter [Burkholderiales bacterium]|nr:multidrug effflux MFS transporter [Burkholderiales bacterium]
MSGSDPRTAIPAWVVVLALALLTGLQPLTTDMYLPALPQMQRDLGMSAAAAQSTLSTLILSFGIGQLVWGPVADRWGRKLVLRSGLSLFVLASVLTVIAPNGPAMVLARAIQGACLAAAVVCGRAMIRDLYKPEDGARVMSKGMTGLGAIALIGPITGGLTATYWGWHATMGALALCGLLILLFVWTQLPETLPDSRRQQQLDWMRLTRQWWGIAQHRTFRAHTLLTSSTYGGLYVYLALGSFAFINVLGCSRTTYGVYMASVSLSYLIGTFFCRKWLPLHGLVGTIGVAGWFSLAGGLWMGGVSFATWLGHQPASWALLPGIWLYGFAHGIHQPCGQTGVVSAFPHQAGAATALSGFILATAAFGVGLLLSQISTIWPGLTQSIHPLNLGMALGGAVTALVARHWVQRDGQPPEMAQ